MSTAIARPAGVPNVSIGDTSDYINSFAPYFGPPPPGSVGVQSAYRFNSQQNLDLPDAYAGQNQFIGLRIEQLTLTNSVFYTQDVLPIRSMRADDGTAPRSITWNTWHFNQHFTDRIPEEGVGRIVSSRRESESRAFFRQGLGFQLEHGFMKTPEGQLNYQRNLRQIADAVQETNNYDVLTELLNVRLAEDQWEARFGRVRKADLVSRLEAEKLNWDIIKKKKGFQTYNALVDEDMLLKGGFADLWLLAPKMITYLNIVPPENTEFWLAGPQGPRLKDSADNRLPKGYLANTNERIYLTRQYIIDRNEYSDPLVRERQIGEWALIGSRYQAVRNVKDYTTEEMSIEVYNEDNDRMARLDAATALRHCMLFDKGGRLRMPDARANVPHYATDILQDPFVKVMRGTQNVPVPIEVFGEMRPEHMPYDGVGRVAGSLMNRLSAYYAGGAQEASAILSTGLRELETIGRRTISNDYFAAVASESKKEDADRVESVMPRKDRYHTSNAQREWVVDAATGTFTLPDLKDEDDAYKPAVKASELVGFTNYPGLLAIDAAFNDGSAAAKGYNMPAIERLSKLKVLIENLAEIINRTLPGSLFTDPRFTPAQYRNRSSAAVLFDNLLGMYQEAVWMRPRIADAANVVDNRDRVVADDVDTRNSLRQVATKLGHFDDGAFVANSETLAVFGVFADAKDGIVGIPTEVANITFEGMAQRRAVARLYSLLNVHGSKTDAAAARKIAAPFFAQLAALGGANGGGGGINTDALFNWAAKNAASFQASSDEMNELLSVLSESVANARRQDRQQGTYYENVYTNAAANIRAGYDGMDVQYAEDAATYDAGTAYRSPLSLSTSQILKLARKPETFDITISYPDGSNDRAATDAEVYSLATDITMLQEDPTAVPRYSSLYMARELGYLRRTFVARTIETRPGDQGALFKRGRSTVDLPRTQTAQKRRRMARSGTGAMGARAQGLAEALDSAYDAPMARRNGASEGAVGMSVGSSLPVSEVSNAFVEMFAAVETLLTNPIQRVFARAYLGTPVTMQVLDTMLAMDVVVPIKFIFARPHMRYASRMGIKMAGGGATGYTFVGDSLFELGDDPTKQMHIGQYRYYSKAVVLNPKNVHLAFDIFIDGTLGGAGVRAIEKSRYNPRGNEYGNGSAFYLAVPYATSEDSIESAFDLSGRFQHYRLVDSDNQESVMRLQYPTAARYNAEWGWRLTKEMGQTPIYDTSSPFRDLVQDDEPRFNTTCWRCYSLHYDRQSGKFNDPEKNTGHWGEETYPGCRSVRRGDLVENNSQRPRMVVV